MLAHLSSKLTNLIISPLRQLLSTPQDLGNSKFEAARLESRVLYSAVPMDLDIVPENGLEYLESLETNWLSDFEDLGQSPHENLLNLAALGANRYFDEQATHSDLDALSDQFPGAELVIVDRNVDQNELLLRDLLGDRLGDSDISVVYIDEADGVSAVTGLLDQFSSLKAVHVLSHGSADGIRLGQIDLNSQTLDGYAGDIASWADAMARDGDIFFYGCEVASNGEGQSFLESISELTQADVAASVDLTGSSEIESLDWELEYVVGDISSGRVLSQAADALWSGTLIASQTNIEFRQGQAEFDGAVDTFLNASSPDGDNSRETQLNVQDGVAQSLIGFEDIFGYGQNQIPFGASINSATLTFVGTENAAAGSTISLNRMLIPWDATSTWNSMTNGIQLDGSEAVASPDSQFPGDGGAATVADVTTAVQAWANGIDNFGWVMTNDNGTNFGFASSEFATQLSRPTLSVSYDLTSVTVTTTNDVFDAPNLSSFTELEANPGADGEISLREAIVAANNQSGLQEIHLPAGNYARSIHGNDDVGEDGDFDILDSVIIRGAGSGLTTVNGSVATNARGFDVIGGSSLIEDVTITGGRLGAEGGAGVGIKAGGELTMRNVVVTNNSTVSSTDGAGIHNRGTLTLEDVAVTNNDSDEEGGGLYNEGAAILRRVTFTGNNADNGGGGVQNKNGTLTAVDLVLNNNTSQDRGGGFDNSGGQVTLTNTTLSNNTASNGGGGINNDGGGATFSLINATVSGNQTSGDAGGGIRTREAITITNSTIANNVSSADGGGVEAGGGNGEASLLNTILSGNTASVAGTENATGNIISLGYNIDDDGSAGLNATGDQTVGSGEILLGVLADNGGYGRAHALLAGSPAINAGTTSNAPATDALGKPRVLTTDIGAQEAFLISGTQADSAPTIDGVLDVGWSANSTEYAIQQVSVGLGEKDSTFNASFRTLWDANNLYFHVSVSDSTPNTDSANHWDDDSVKIFVDGDNSDNTTYDGVNDVHIGFKRDGSISILDGPSSFVAGDVNYFVDDDASGYRVEVSIPWAELGVSPANNHQYGFEVHVNDDENGGTRESKIEWASGADQAHLNPSVFGSGVLSGTIVPDNRAPTGLLAGIELNADGGNNAYFQAGDGAAVLGGRGRFTFETRFAGDPAAPQSTLMSYFVGGEQSHVVITSGGDLDIRVGNSQVIGSGLDYRTLLDGNIHSLAFAWDNTGGDWGVYVDGTLTDSGTGLQAGYTTGTGELVFGQEQDSLGGGFDPAQAFSGTLYDVRFWDHVRSANEIQFNQGHVFDKSDLPTGLIANWQMGGFESSQVVDVVTGNNLDVRATTDPGFTASTPTDQLGVDENSSNGTSVGFVVPIDPDDYDQQVAAILASDNTLAYDATTNEFYRRVHSSEDWVSARSNAASDLLNGVSGQLVRIESNYENNIIRNLAGAIGGDVWLGGNDIVAEGNWRWSDGSSDGELFWSGAPVNSAYVNWETGEPNLPAEDAMFLAASNGKWHNIDAAASRQYIVEWDANEVIGNFSFSLIDDASGRFQIDSSSGELTVVDGTLLDFETDSSHSITVEVSDAQGLAYQGTLQVHIGDVNESPTLLVTNLAVSQLASESIRTSITAGDPDAADSDDQLTLTLTALPSHGTLRLSGTALGLGNTFTYADVVAELVSYEHNGSSSPSDSFGVSLADGGENGVATLSETVTVNLANSAPIANNDTFYVNEDATLDTATDWFDLNWGSRQKLVFDNSGQATDLVDFPVLVQLDPSFFDYGNVQSNGEDLRFVDSDGSTILDYEIEEWDPVGVSSIWVRVPQIDGGSDTDFVWMYYENASAAAGESSADVWALDYQMVHHLSGPTVDSTINGVTALASSSTDEGVIGGGEQFAPGQIINFGSEAAIEDIFDNGGTVSGWIRADSSGENGYGRIFDKATDIVPNPAGWDLSVRNAGGDIGLLFEFGFDGGHGEWFTPGSLNAGQWHHVAVSYDSSSSSNDPLFYVDGVQVGATEGMPPIGNALTDSGQSLVAGNQSVTFNRAFDGVLDELRFESRVRTADEVAADVLSASGNFVRFELDGVLTNDVDLDGGPLNAVVVSGPSNGQLTLSPDGNFVYEPDPDFTGTDSFTYEAGDGTDTSIAMVTINVAPTNDAPFVVGTAPFLMPDVLQDTTDSNGIPVGFLLSNSGSGRANDVDGDLLGIGVTGVDDSNGVWQFSTDGGTTYTDFSSVGVSISGADVTHSVLLGPGSRLRFVPTASYTGPAGDLDFVLWDQTAFTAGDTNVDATVTSGGAFSTSGGIATLHVDSAAGVAVTPPSSQTLVENESFTFSVADSTSFSVTDDSVDDSVMRVRIEATNGTVSILHPSGVVFVEGTTNDTSVIVIEGVESELNQALDDLTFTPTTEFVGVANVAVTAGTRASLIGEYLLDDVSAADTSPQGNSPISNTGSLVNDPERGSVHSFTQPESLEVAGQLGQPSNVSFSAWVNLDSSLGAYLLDIGRGFILTANVHSFGTGVAMTFDDGTTTHSLSSGFHLNNTGWHHIAAVFDDANDIQAIYIDGVVAATGSLTQSIAYQNTNTFIGPNWGAPSFGTMLDDVRIYDRALSGGEIKTLATDQITDTDVVVLTVNSTDPIADNDAATVDEGASTTIDVLSNDSGRNAPLENSSVVIVNPPTHANSLAMLSDGTIVYTHDGSETTTDSFTYTVLDTEGDVSNEATVVITINPVNDSPVASAGVLTLSEGFNATIRDTELSATDAESSTSDLTWTITTQPQHGFVSLNGTDPTTSFTQADIEAGLVTYAHGGDEGSSDVIVLEVEDADGETVSDQRIDLIILPVNDDPVAMTGDFGLMESGSFVLSRSNIDVTDPDNTPAEINVFVDVPTNGWLERTSDPGVAITTFTLQEVDEGLIRYVHDGSSTTTDDFRFGVNDTPAAISPPYANEVNISISTTNDLPVVSIGTSTVTEGAFTVVDASQLQAMDEESSASQLTWTVTTEPVHGFLTLDGTNPVNSFTQADIDASLVRYVHDAGEEPDDSVELEIRDADNGSVSNQRLHINIVPVNDAPTIAAPVSQLVIMGTTQVFDTVSGNSVVVADVDAGQNAVELQLSVDEGTISLATTDSLTFVVGDGTSDATMTIRGKLEDINTALDGLSYNPAIGFSGASNLNIGIDDLGNSGTVHQTGSAVVSLNVAQRPVAVDDNYQILVSVDETLMGDLLGNDSVPAGVIVTAPNITAGGTLSVQSNGVFSFAPTPGFIGEASFEYTMTSIEGLVDVGTVVINVTGALPPTAGEPTSSAPTPSTSDISPPTPSEETDAGGSSASSGESATGVGARLEEKDTPTKRQPPRNVIEGSMNVPVLSVEVSESKAESSSIEAHVAYWQRRFSDTSSITRTSESNQILVDVARHQFPAMLFEELDDLSQSIISSNRWDSTSLAVATTSSAVGWFIWSLRGGYVAASLLSTVSPWVWVDPLPVLESMPVERRRSRNSNATPTGGKERNVDARTDQLEVMMKR